MRQVIDGAFISMLEGRDLCIRKPMDGMFGGNRRSRAYGSSAEFADYREYVPGDDLRRVDWNLYARFEKMFLKLFTDERQLHHKIYIDASASMDWGEPNKADTALKLGAALAFLSVQAMDRVSFHVIHEDYCENSSRTIVGREAFYRAAEELNRMEFYGNSDLGAAINKIENPGNKDGISVLISDFLTDSDWKSAVDYLLFHKREVQLIQVLSRDEIMPSASGKVFLIDSESLDEEDEKNYRTELSRASYRAYQEAFAYMQEDIKNFCHARGVGFLSVCTDESIERLLFLKATEEGLIQ